MEESSNLVLCSKSFCRYSCVKAPGLSDRKRFHVKNYTKSFCCRELALFTFSFKFLIIVPLLLLSPVVEAASASRSSKEKVRELQHGIEKIIQTADPDVHVGIEIVSMKTGQKLYARNANHLFMPASNLKLATCAAALQVLGADYRFQTQLHTDAPIEQGVVKGSLWIKGSGDPELSTRDLADLVFQLKLKGISKVEGHLYIDHFDFDQIAQGPGWTWDDGAVAWNSPMDALTLNHSCVDVWVKPNSHCDQPPQVCVQPKTDFVKVENCAITSQQEKDLVVERAWMTRENRIQIKGSVPLNEEAQHFAIPVESPHLYAASILCHLLEKNGIVLQGEVHEKAVPAEARQLAIHSSRPLFEIIVEMMKVSDNLIADCLFKKIGQQVAGPPGSWQKGSQAVRDFLAKTVGMDVSKMVILDGSGMSRYNLMSPHQLVQLLTWIDQKFLNSSELISSLPVSGVDGCLKNRMTDPSIKGRVRAKTGTLSGASTLSGYVVTQAGEKLVFSIMISGFTKQSSEYKTQIEDQIVQYIAQCANFR